MKQTKEVSQKCSPHWSRFL